MSRCDKPVTRGISSIIFCILEVYVFVVVLYGHSNSISDLSVTCHAYLKDLSVNGFGKDPTHNLFGTMLPDKINPSTAVPNA